MTLDIEQLRRHIPFYLAAEDARALISELKAFSAGSNPGYYLSDYHNDHQKDVLQGDGWSGFQLYLFETGERRSARGMVLSNSCDIDPANKREIPSRIVFAPLVKLAAYKKLLNDSGIASEAVDAKIAAIQSQKTTNIFYLPPGGSLKEDYVIRFDDIHSMPLGAHKRPAKLFTLSMVGFYLFVLKLSIHFCRLHENVDRRNPERQ